MSHLSAHFYTRSSQSHKSSLKFGKSLLQLGRINHCEYIPAVLVQIKVTTAARKRQQQDKPLKKNKKQKKGHRPLSHPAQCQECGGDGRRWELHEGCRRLQPSSRTGIWSRRRTARALCGFFGRGVVVAAPVHLMSLWFVWFILPKFHWLWVRLSQSSVHLTLWAA